MNEQLSCSKIPGMVCLYSAVHDESPVRRMQTAVARPHPIIIVWPICVIIVTRGDRLVSSVAGS